MFGFSKKDHQAEKSFQVKKAVSASSTKGFARVSLLDKPSNIVIESDSEKGLPASN
ncbi:hypothetical protein JCM19046_2879 [Bacillus sp. JCM 19046]|nr:hypothetical protein JCM19045_455 [Bacillus sp. JCM 19045]GAF18312.1 hypothetical protein JCM19046_2879 [Bacillus sp. JCM 19046]